MMYSVAVLWAEQQWKDPQKKSVPTLDEVCTDPLRCPYRPFHLGIQGNPLGSTGKVLREYRRI